MTPDTQDEAKDRMPDHGIPPEATEAESKGMPNSDRDKAEKAPVDTETSHG